MSAAQSASIDQNTDKENTVTDCICCRQTLCIDQTDIVHSICRYGLLDSWRLSGEQEDTIYGNTDKKNIVTDCICCRQTLSTGQADIVHSTYCL